MIDRFKPALYPSVNSVLVYFQQHTDFKDGVAAELLYAAMIEMALCQVRPVFGDFNLYTGPRMRGCKAGEYGERRGIRENLPGIQFGEPLHELF